MADGPQILRSLPEENQALKLALPITVAPGLYRQGFTETLRGICTPCTEAKPGDIVGILGEWRLQGRSISSYPITQVVRISTDASSGTPEIVGFTDLPECQQQQISHACMKLQCIGVDAGAAYHLASQLDPDDGETYFFNLLLMPEQALLFTDHPVETVYEGCYQGEERDQDQVDSAFLLCLPRSSISNHDLVSLRSGLQATADLVNALFPIIDDEYEEALPLHLPDLHPLTRGEATNSL